MLGSKISLAIMIALTETGQLSNRFDSTIFGKSLVNGPKKIYIRKCMKLIFSLFSQDTRGERSKPRELKTVLLGSPGVGKSVLFFLAALYQAKSSYTVYYRRTTKESDISIFLVMPYQNNTVRVWFARDFHNFNLPEELISVHRQIFGFQEDRGGKSDDDSLYTFVDGPRYSDKMNT